MTLNTNHPGDTAPPDARVRCASERCPGLPVRALRLAAEATRWAAYVAALVPCGPFCPHRKALDALAFSLRAGLGVFSIPTKLVGVKSFQEAIRALRDSGAAFGLRLALVERGGRLAVVWGAQHVLGYIQEKHEPWLRPLAGLGVELRLIAVTGREEDGQTLGVNLAICPPPGLDAAE